MNGPMKASPVAQGTGFRALGGRGLGSRGLRGGGLDMTLEPLALKVPAQQSLLTFSGLK